MTDTRTRPNLCTKCGYMVDAATGVSNGRDIPKPGDVSVCLNCGAVHIFTIALLLREPTQEEIDSFEPGFKAFLQHVEAARRTVVPSGGLPSAHGHGRS